MFQCSLVVPENEIVFPTLCKYHLLLSQHIIYILFHVNKFLSRESIYDAPGNRQKNIQKIIKNRQKIIKEISMALIITIQVLYDLSKEFLKVDVLFVVMATITWCIFRKTIQKMIRFIQRLCSSIFRVWEDAELR
jgi:hypothetical protein